MNKIENGLDKVVFKLGEHAKFFEVDFHELLVDADGYFAMTIAIKPKPKRMEEYQVCGSTCIIELTKDGDGPWQMIFGEDSEREISLANLYCFMYWCEATEEIEGE